MSEIVTIDTREQTEEHTFKLITSNNPEGTVFTVNPMGAGTYLKFMDKVKTLQALNAQDMSSKQLLKIQNDLCNLLIPSSPRPTSLKRGLRKRNRNTR